MEAWFSEPRMLGLKTQSNLDPFLSKKRGICGPLDVSIGGEASARGLFPPNHVHGLVLKILTMLSKEDTTKYKETTNCLEVLSNNEIQTLDEMKNQSSL